MDTDKDRMITAYRNHVMPIGLGVDPKKLWQSYMEKVQVHPMAWVGQCIFFQKNTDSMVAMELLEVDPFRSWYGLWR